MIESLVICILREFNWVSIIQLWLNNLYNVFSVVKVVILDHKLNDDSDNGRKYITYVLNNYKVRKYNDCHIDDVICINKQNRYSLKPQTKKQFTKQYTIKKIIIKDISYKQGHILWISYSALEMILLKEFTVTLTNKKKAIM